MEGSKKEDNLPSLDACKKAWAKVDSQTVKSSDAEAATGSERGKKDLQFDMEQLQQLLGRENGSSGSSSSDSESEMETRARAAHFLPPGRGSLPKERNKSAEVDVSQLMLRQAPSELMPLMMMSMLASQSSKNKCKRRGLFFQGHRKSKGGGLSSPPSQACEKAPRPRAKEMTHDLGVIPGQAWSVRDYLRKQQWGKFKRHDGCRGLRTSEVGRRCRSSRSTLAKYEGKDAECDPRKRLELSMASYGITGSLGKEGIWRQPRRDGCGKWLYVEALHRLRKKVLESKGHGAAEDEEEEGAGRRK